MSNQLTLSIGQHTHAGRKSVNQDFHGALVPREPQRLAKGVALALADGIGSSDVSHVASSTAVTAFLDDYYGTPDSWSVKTSAERVLAATNAWLYAQTRQSQGRYDQDGGYVTTFSALVVKSSTAHLFHVGDARIYRVHPGAHGAHLEQLTTDHRVWVSPERSYLARALGVDAHVEIDYRTVPLDAGDVFLLATDGVYEHVTGLEVAASLAGATDLDEAAARLVQRALDNGSPDNLTVQFVRIESLRAREAHELLQRMADLPFPPPQLAPRSDFDGYRIVRELHGSSRSHVYLAQAPGGTPVVLKTPSTDLATDRASVERFLMEDWVARRIDSVHVARAAGTERERGYVYLALEHIDGVTLAQWLQDHPKPALEAVRGIVEQVAKGLRAFHRLEMLHQDIRPENIMIDATGTVKIIDFGAVSIEGVAEMALEPDAWTLLGAAPFAAPEYFLGERGTVRSDVFGLGVLAYRMLTGSLPYGLDIPRCKSRAEQKKLAYTPAREHDPAIPAWVDEALRRAVQIEPGKRYADVSEFVYDLRHPNRAYLGRTRPPLVERHPVLIWKAASFGLLLALVADLAFRH